MAERLQGKKCFVTAAAQGIGRATVEAWSAEGASIVATDLNAEKLAELDGLPGVETYPLDVTDQAAVAAMAAEVGAVDVLFNCAGFVDHGSLLDTTMQGWDFSFELNCRSLFVVTQAFVPAMLANGGGSIINMSSNSFMLKVGGMPGYLTAKSGIVGLTRALATELGPHKIRVNSILPGWVMTQRQIDLWLTPEAEQELLDTQCIKRKIEPEDVAKLSLFLASNDSEMITAQSLIIDGGRT